MNKTTSLLLGSFLSVALGIPPAFAQAPEWKTLHEEAIAQYKKGDYERAEVAATRALESATAALGPDHPNIATGLANRATILESRRKYTEAQADLTRALAIREKALGPDHLLVASTLNNLGSLLRDRGQTAQAEPLLVRALAIREKALPADSIDVATSLNNLAAVYRCRASTPRPSRSTCARSRSAKRRWAHPTSMSPRA